MCAWCAALSALTWVSTETAATETSSLFEQRISSLFEQRISSLEQRLAKFEASDSCQDEFPLLKGTVTYSGCNRNIIRANASGWPGNATTETCQSGVLAYYNTSSTPKTGLFDARLTVLHSPDRHAVGSTYHFTCTYSRDGPHVGTCTLIFQEPPEAVGPALVTIRLTDVVRSASGLCTASSATIIGNYLYDSRQHAAGVYSFYAPSAEAAAHQQARKDQARKDQAASAAERDDVEVHAMEQRGDVEVHAMEREALIDLAKATAFDGWVHNHGWLGSETISVCDWDLVGCDGEGRVKVLTLDFNNLKGHLPSTLGALSRLQDLDLEGNALLGELPPGLGALRSLRQLGLGGGLTHFNGTLPPDLCGPLGAIVGAARGRPAPNKAVPCDLSGSIFTCPLPCAAAAACGATCR